MECPCCSRRTQQVDCPPNLPSLYEPILPRTRHKKPPPPLYVPGTYFAPAANAAEIRHRQLRAQADKVAPRFCTSAASFLFSQSLDPDATGAVATSSLASFAIGLLGLSADARFRAGACFSSEAPHGVSTGTPRGTAASGGSGGRRSPRRGFSSLVRAGNSSASTRNRARRYYGVVERMAKTAGLTGSCQRNGKRTFQGGRSSHPRQEWAQPDTPSQDPELVAPADSRPFFDVKAIAVRRGQEARGSDSSEMAITQSTFCQFVEGKKFDCKASLEGFLRTLAGTGRLLPAHGAVAEGEGASQGRAPFYATTARRGMPSAEGGSPGTVGTARWGARGLRRASSQFAQGVLPTRRWSVDSSTTMAAHGRGRASTMTAQAHVVVATSSLPTTATARGGGGGYGGGGSSARSSALVSSRLGTTATPRSGANTGGTLNTTRGGIRVGGCVAAALLSFDVNGSGALSSAEFIRAANRVTGLPVRQEWGEVLAKRFARGRHGVENERGAPCAGGGGGSGGEGVRWMGGGEEGDEGCRLDIAALVDFLRPRSFSLSVMTPFGKSSSAVWYGVGTSAHHTLGSRGAVTICTFSSLCAILRFRGRP